MFRLCIVKNPFNPAQGREVKPMGHGVTVRQLLDEYKPDGEIVLKATVNAHSVEDDYVVQDGDYVVLYPYIGKGGAKRLFSIVAMIGLTLAANAVGAWADSLVVSGTANATWGIAGYLAAAATMFIGGAIISHFTPKANLDRGKFDDGKNTATYSWNGPQVMEGQNNAIPVIYGKLKTAGQSIGKYVNTDGDKEYLNWLIAAGEGPLSITDIKINDNPVSYYDGVEVYTREGTNDQEIIPNFNDTYFTSEYNYKLNTNERIVTVQGNGTQGIVVSVEFPNGLYYANDKGGLDTAWVELDCGWRKKGNKDWISFFPTKTGIRVSGATSSAIRRQWRVDNLDAGEYEVMVKITGRSHDENSNRASVKAYLTGVSSIVYDDFSYPNVALVGLRALATDQLNGTPSVSFMVERKNVWVYNPHSMMYEKRPANNPAWASYDYVHQCRRIKNIHTGEYEFVVEGADKRLMLYDQFKEWADFCEEKNLHINYCDDGEGRLMEKLNTNIAPVGRGYVLWFGTKCGCVFESVKEPVQMFGMGNIISGTFQEDFMQTSDRANAIELTFNNAANDYERTTITVYGDNYDSEDAITKTTQVTYNGITDYEQAYRTAKFLLACNQYLVRTVSFEASVDAIACQIGDLILVSHDVTRWAYSGRIEKVEGTKLTLPCELDDLTKNYKVMYRTRDDVLHEKNVTIESSANGWTVCSVTKWDNDAPQPNDVFDLSYVETGAKPFVVKSITRTQDLVRKIECLEYNENIYNENYDVPAIDYSMDAVSLQNVISLHAKQAAYIEEDVKICKMYASWELPNGATDCKYEIQLSTDGETYTTVRNFYPYKSVTIDTEFGKSYYIKVISLYGNKKSAGSVYGPIAAAVTEAPPVTGLYAYNRYRTQNDGKSRYDIVVKWTVPGGPSYSQAQVWYKTDHDQADSIVVKEGVSADELGFQGSWKYAGQGYDEVTIPQANVGDTYKIAVVSVDRWGTIGDPDTSPQTKILVMTRSELPNTPSNFKLAFGETATARWDEVTNTDIMFYEVRRDDSPGEKSEGLLTQTGSTSADLALTWRTGNLYLYAKNALGKYSWPAKITYNKPAPAKPEPPTVKNTMTGFTVSTKEIPADAIGMIVYIKDKEAIKTENAVLSYNCEPGIYDVAIAYYDMFGAGERSATVHTVVKIIIDETNIKDMAISLQKVDKHLQDVFNTTIPNMEKGISKNLDSIQTLNNTTIPNMQEGITQNSDSITALVKDGKGYASAIAQNTDSINTLVQDGKGYASAIAQNTDSINTLVQDGKGYASAIAQNSTSITSVVTNLGDSAKAKEAYSAIAQMQDDIALRVKSGEVISQINLSKEGVQIDGKLLHVTGETVFDNNIVTSKMLQAANISLEGALAITGGNVFLNEDGMQVTQSNGESIMFDGKGMTFFDASGNAYNSVRRMIIGTAKHNQYVRFPVAWPTAPKVLVTPLSVTTADNNKSGAIIRIHCRATDVSTNGFRVMCYSGIDNTSYWQSVNTDLGSFSGARGYRDGSIHQTFSWTKNISVDSRARLIRLNLYFSGNWHARGDGIGIGKRSTNDAPFTRVTVTAAGKTVLSEDVGGTDGGYFDNWSGQSVQTSQFQIPSVSTITVNIQWRPRVHHPGKSNDAGDVGDGKCTLQSIEGTMQGDDSTQVIDSDGTALFLAVDQSTQNYSVS